MNQHELENAMRFYILATQLKYKIRSGWDNKHWNVKGRRESVAEHVYGTCILAIAIASEFHSDIDLEKVIKMLVLHEIGEVIIGDITPFDDVTPEEKLRREHAAIIDIVGDLIAKDEIISLLFEFDEHKTKESIFAYHCDKFDAVAQSKIYQDMKRHWPLKDRHGNVSKSQGNNVAFNYPQIHEIIEAGAETPFDVWYEADKEKFADDEVFMQMLEYLKNINTQELQ